MPSSRSARWATALDAYHEFLRLFDRVIELDREDAFFADSGSLLLSSAYHLCAFEAYRHPDGLSVLLVSFCLLTFWTSILEIHAETKHFAHRKVPFVFINLC